MAIVSMQLDPNAVAYSDDEIVGKVNAAAANISRAGSVLAAARPIAAGEIGATELEHEAFLTAEKSKLTGIDEGAKIDQTGPEVRDLVVAIAPAERKLIVTDPAVGEHKVTAVQRNAVGELDVDYDDVPEAA